MFKLKIVYFKACLVLTEFENHLPILASMKFPPFIGLKKVTINGVLIIYLTIEEKLELIKMDVDEGLPLYEIGAKIYMVL